MHVLPDQRSWAGVTFSVRSFSGSLLLAFWDVGNSLMAREDQATLPSLGVWPMSHSPCVNGSLEGIDLTVP